VSDRPYLLDASAVIALVLSEPAAQDVAALMVGSKIHAVNLIEVITKLRQRGMPDPAPVVARLPFEVLYDLTPEEVETCGELHADARAEGLSLGDCICLAVAKVRSFQAVTRDKLGQQVGERHGIEVWLVPVAPRDASQ
jgi:ribonuclease VapC